MEPSPTSRRAKLAGMGPYAIQRGWLRADAHQRQHRNGHQHLRLRGRDSLRVAASSQTRRRPHGAGSGSGIQPAPAGHAPLPWHGPRCRQRRPQYIGREPGHAVPVRHVFQPTIPGGRAVTRFDADRMVPLTPAARFGPEPARNQLPHRAPPRGKGSIRVQEMVLQGSSRGGVQTRMFHHTSPARAATKWSLPAAPTASAATRRSVCGTPPGAPPPIVHSPSGHRPPLLSPPFPGRCAPAGKRPGRPWLQPRGRIRRRSALAAQPAWLPCCAPQPYHPGTRPLRPEEGQHQPGPCSRPARPANAAIAAREASMASNVSATALPSIPTACQQAPTINAASGCRQSQPSRICLSPNFPRRTSASCRRSCSAWRWTG